MDDVNESCVRWDLLVLTARNKLQKITFENQIVSKYFKYFEKYFVVVDFPENVKIGSGGATLNVIQFLFKKFGDQFFQMRTLLVHSGGHSQRLPHVSALGKIFMTMPDGRSLIEAKLESYVPVLQNLTHINRGGLFIASADTLEVFATNESDLRVPYFDILNESEIILFAHETSTTIALDHGVYIADGNSEELICVLQKPTLEELKLSEGYITNGIFLTDSCYFFGSSLLKDLLEMKTNNGSINCEICCYGDFLRPLGKRPKLGYLLNEKSPELQVWRQKIRNVMNGRNSRLINLGENSFIHFGTNIEMLNNFFENQLCTSFLATKNFKNVVHSVIDDLQKVSSRSFVEYSILTGNFEVKKGCIISGVEINTQFNRLVIEANTLLFSLCLNKTPKTIEWDEGQNEDLNDLEYVTFLFNTTDNLKKTTLVALKWQEHNITPLSETELWTVPIFPTADTLAQSFEKTLQMKIDGPNVYQNEKRVSVKEALLRVNVVEMLKVRNVINSVFK